MRLGFRVGNHGSGHLIPYRCRLRLFGIDIGKSALACRDGKVFLLDLFNKRIRANEASTLISIFFGLCCGLAGFGQLFFANLVLPGFGFGCAT